MGKGVENTVCPLQSFWLKIPNLKVNTCLLKRVVNKLQELGHPAQVLFNTLQTFLHFFIKANIFGNDSQVQKAFYDFILFQSFEFWNKTIGQAIEKVCNQINVNDSNIFFNIM